MPHAHYLYHTIGVLDQTNMELSMAKATLVFSVSSFTFNCIFETCSFTVFSKTMIHFRQGTIPPLLITICSSLDPLILDFVCRVFFYALIDQIHYHDPELSLNFSIWSFILTFTIRDFSRVGPTFARYLTNLKLYLKLVRYV